MNDKTMFICKVDPAQITPPHLRKAIGKFMNHSKHFKSLKSLVTLSVLVSSAAFAQKSVETSTQVGEINGRPILKKEDLNSVYLGTSEYHRLKKQGTITANFGGIEGIYGGTTGLMGGFFLNSNSVLQVSSMSSNQQDLWGFSETGISGYRKSNHIGVNFQHFPGNSFFIRPGIEYVRFDRRLVTSYSRISNLEASAFSLVRASGYDLSGESIYAKFSIGNQWQWENFTLGCDWIGASIPLSHKITQARTFDKNLNNIADDSYLRDDRERMKSSYLTAVTFYLGASF